MLNSILLSCIEGAVGSHLHPLYLLVHPPPSCCEGWLITVYSCSLPRELLWAACKLQLLCTSRLTYFRLWTVTDWHSCIRGQPTSLKVGLILGVVCGQECACGISLCLFSAEVTFFLSICPIPGPTSLAFLPRALPFSLSGSISRPKSVGTHMALGWASGFGRLTDEMAVKAPSLW